MAIPPVFAPPPVPSALTAQAVASLVSAAQQNAAATLAAAVIASGNRSYSVKDALVVLRDVQNSLFPMPGNGAWEAWKKEFAGKP